jgi:DNA polymerase I-like protein with 3'-5' exonuclease and polymerase domains
MCKYAYLDYEYHNTSEAEMSVVCCAFLLRDNGVTIEKGVVWLHEDAQAQSEFALKLQTLADLGCVFLSYNIIAEASATLSLAPIYNPVDDEITYVNPAEWKLVDLLSEVKQVRNGNYKRLYGKYLDKNGNKKTSYPPITDERGKAVVLEKGDPRKKNNSKTNIDLASSLYAFLDVEIDYKHKKAMQQLILSGKYTEEQKAEIMRYAGDDVEYLPELFRVLQKEIRTLTRQTFDEYLKAAFIRGEWSARLAIIERTGIPVDRPRLERIRDSRGEILNEWIEMLCNDYYPFYLKNKKGEWVYSTAQKVAWVEAKGLEKEWPKTKAKKPQFSFSKEVMKDYEELYPEIKELSRIRNFDSQTKSYSSKKDEGFEEIMLFEPEEDEVTTEGKESIFDRIGTDERLRCYFGPYGTQTSRNAPPARSFILAQAKWIRSCMRPPEGWCITSIDYSAEEFIIAACEAKDKNMEAAYDMKLSDGSQDVYLAFAILANAVPKNATKKTHKELRTRFKSTVLGKQFGMGVSKLHKKIIADTGDRTVTEDQAKELDAYHKETFSDYWDFVKDTLDTYNDGVPLKTRDGWYLFTDNPNQMSVANFRIQGAGGAILRAAVRNAQRAGVRVIAPLHDALYILHREDEQHHIPLLRDAMNKAFRDFYGRDIRMEAKTWRNKDEMIEEGGERTFALLAKYFMSKEEYTDWPLLTNVVS